MESKKYSQLKKEVKRISLAQTATAFGGAALSLLIGIAIHKYGAKDMSEIKQMITGLAPLFVAVVSVEVMEAIIKKLENKKEHLYYRYENKKDEYLKAFYKDRESLTSEEKEVLFGYAQHNHIELDKTVKWFESYELALSKGQQIGISKVKNFGATDNFEEIEQKYIYINEKNALDLIVDKHLQEIKSHLECGVGYCEFKMILPRNDMSGKELKNLTLGFTNIEQVEDFQKQMKIVKRKALKYIYTKKERKALDEGKKAFDKERLQ